MLNERNKVIENNKGALFGHNDNYANGLMGGNSATTVLPFDDKLAIKGSSDSNMNFIKNGQLSPSTAQKLSQITLSKCLSSSGGMKSSMNGSGAVKAERLSPPLVNDLSIYR
jgi:hypothetical protein